MRTVWIYERGEELMVFATEDDAREWFKENDPEGVAFEHKVEQVIPAGSADQHGVPRAEE
jgi:hypothetical protein